MRKKRETMENELIARAKMGRRMRGSGTGVCYGCLFGTQDLTEGLTQNGAVPRLAGKFESWEAHVSAQMKKFLAILVMTGLVAAPAMSAPAKPLGVVVQANKAQIGVGEATDGATVFAGDQATTQEKGTLRVRLGSAQIYLMANSAAAFEPSENGVSAALSRGSVGFSATPTDAVEVRFGGLSVRAKDGQSAHGMVTVTGANELTVTSYSGSLEVVAGEEVRAIAAGNTYKAMLAAPDPQQPQGAAKRGSPLLLLLLLGGAAVGAGVWLMLRGDSQSPS